MKSFRLLVLAAALVLSYAVAAAAAPACTKKIDSFDFVVDYSGSMMMKNAQLKQDKIIVAKSVLQRINAAIPALNYNGGLHTISPNGVIVAQGPWDRATMAAGINKLRSGFDVFGRMTRMGTGLQAYEPFLSSMKRDAAVILVTDGDNNRGMDLVEVVPMEDNLLIEARVLPKDIAFLRPGLPAIVKVTAYDFAIYGGLKGTLEHISADTIQDEKGNAFYLVRVRTEKSYLGDISKPMPIIPGMMATADIITGKKSVLEYLLKPIIRAKQSALRER